MSTVSIIEIYQFKPTNIVQMNVYLSPLYAQKIKIDFVGNEMTLFVFGYFTGYYDFMKAHLENLVFAEM